MSCEECVRRSALHIALLTPDATSAQLKTFFAIMYPTENCRPLLGAFLMEARAGAPVRRKPVQVAPELAVAAVA